MIHIFVKTGSFTNGGQVNVILQSIWRRLGEIEFFLDTYRMLINVLINKNKNIIEILI